MISNNGVINLLDKNSGNDGVQKRQIQLEMLYMTTDYHKSVSWYSFQRTFFLIPACGLLCLAVLLVNTNMSYAEPGKHLYTTGEVMEVDRCASAWLIKRFVDQEAFFKLYPEESIITSGTVFDRPEAALQRTHNLSTFEVILHKYNINDDRLKQLAERIHDIEINFWGKKKHPDSRIFEAALRKQISNNEQNSEKCLADCFLYIDKFFQKLTSKN